MIEDKGAKLLHNLNCMDVGLAQPSEIVAIVPPEIQLIWHGVNDLPNMNHFLSSPIPWAEGDVRGGVDGEVVLRHDPFETHPIRPEEAFLKLEHWIEGVHQGGKRIQIDLKEGQETMRQVVSFLRNFRIDSDRLWFTANLKDISLEDYGWLHRQFPEAIFQSAIPLRFMFDLMDSAERQLWLQINHDVGVRSLAISWFDHPQPIEIEQLKEGGFQVNFYHVETVLDFQNAIALKPLAITSDFHIPEWNLFGRGSGENGFYKLKQR